MLKHFQKLLKFSTPIILGQLGMMFIGIGDVYIASIYSTEAVAGTGIMNGLFFPVLIAGIGMVVGVSPQISTKLGEKKKVDQYLFSLMLYASVIGIIISILMYLLMPFITIFNYEEVIVKNMFLYGDIVIWSVAFSILFEVLREYLQAFEKVFYTNLVAIICVFLNLLFNYILVFGKFGFPELGVEGLAYTSFVIRFIMFFCLLVPILKEVKVFKVYKNFLKEVFDFSYPIAIMFFFEVLAFSLITLLAGKFGVISAAANYIALNIASTSFTIVLSISRASAVKIGYYKGEKNYPMLITYIQCTYILTAICTVLSCIIYFLFPRELMEFFTNDIPVIELGIRLLFVVAIFQLFDGLQICLQGILRGLGITKITSIVVIIAYWFLGLPCGVYLAYYTDFESLGVWIGVSIALFFIAAVLSYVLNKALAKEKKLVELAT